MGRQLWRLHYVSFLEQRLEPNVWNTNMPKSTSQHIQRKNSQYGVIKQTPLYSIKSILEYKILNISSCSLFLDIRVLWCPMTVERPRLECGEVKFYTVIASASLCPTALIWCIKTISLQVWMDKSKCPGTGSKWREIFDTWGMAKAAFRTFCHPVLPPGW